MESKKKDAKQSLKLIYPEDLDTIYSNHVQFYVSNWDFVFDFGIVQPLTQKVNVSLRIAMSPSHAKQFALKLMKNVKNYEETFGVVNVEPRKK